LSWERLEGAAPDIARGGRERLAGMRVALIGTLRKDGGPRISPIEPFFGAGELLFGAMAWSRKARDLQRDARCVVHSALTAPDAGESELKLYGRAVEPTAEALAECRDGWWVGRPPESVWVFSLAIEAATLIDWDLVRGEMTIRRWSAARGYREHTRSYP
jgi:hypothetical protein